MDATDCGIVGSVLTKTKISVTSTATARSWARGATAQHLEVEGAHRTPADHNTRQQHHRLLLGMTTNGTERRERSYKVTVLPKLQYCRVVSRECCGAGGAAYTSDAVERHLCSLRVPWDRERLTRVGHAAPPPPPAEAPPPPPPPGPFIYNTHTRLTARRPAAPPDDGTERPTPTDVLMVTGQTLTPDARRGATDRSTVQIITVQILD
ncbi:unnamed protein product [Pieris brassicae]|uniref:Uncharacterized protein n=1 Tax=Pieris brassicae TaxID=7116 RepID=A0A9P0XK21_PIEBR|nr:unnamed protein product [Pieris brassicae]